MLNFIFKDLKNNEDGIAMLGVIITIIIVAMTSITMLITSSNEGALVEKGVDDTQARYVAEAGINGIAYQLTTYSNWDSSAWSGVTLADTSLGTATINSMTFTGYGATVDLSINGTLGNKVRQLQVTLQLNVPGLMGAGSFRTSTPTITGGATIDGRNHECDGTLIEDASGTWGVVTNQPEAGFTLGSSAVKVGATNHGLDYEALNTTDDRVLFDYTEIPDSPDKVFGADVPHGTLKSISNTSSGHYYDFRDSMGTEDETAFTVNDGVNFVELDCGQAWKPQDISMHPTTSNAVLVVHAIGADPSNPCTNSIYQGQQGMDFKGIMIVDNLQKIHGTVVGGLIAVGNNPAGLNLGNGQGEILYSRCILSDLFEEILEPGSTVQVKASKWQENALDWQGLN